MRPSRLSLGAGSSFRRPATLAVREQQHPEHGGRPCRAEKIALHFGSAERAEQIPLLFRLHALRRRLDITRRGDVYDRLHDA